MATLEYWQRKEEEAKDELNNANAALERFREGEDGQWLAELKRKGSIAASIFTDHLVVDPLTDFVPLVPTKHPNELDHIARLFQAWKLAITDLKHFYHTDKTVESAWSAKHLCGYQNLFPYPNLLIIDDKKVEFTYEFWMSSSKSMLCASEGLAPQLFCVDREIVPGCTMIIIYMENIKEAKPLHKITFNLKKDQDQVFQDIQQAISLLHHNNLVFADLRPNNVLVYEKDQLRRAMLVDFDWTEVAGKDCYLLFMNHENIDWPAGAISIFDVVRPALDLNCG
ncbi:2464_t:CDS:2 [Paraglomus occultum]|uniref:2464_t:CDS:1 n=1 Tax=Paraglomus occultum TaxID=144539 RepID=A0A9N9DKX0_9GLOM|nr:2464_t:CDS:2 [Paraglomus occultum]